MIKSGTFFVHLYVVAIRMIRSCNFSINQYAVAIIKNHLGFVGMKIFAQCQLFSVNRESPSHQGLHCVSNIFMGH